MEKQALLEKWEDVLAADGAPVLNHKEGIARLLENEESYLVENGAVAADMAQYTPILVPAVRRIFPNLIANELVSVQPMQQPTGYAYALRYAYAGNKAEADAGKFGGVSNTDKSIGNSQFGANLGDTYTQPSFGSFAILASDPNATFGATVTLQSTAATATVTVQYSEPGRCLVTYAASAVNAAVAGATISAGITSTEASPKVVATFNNEAGYNLIFKRYIERTTTANGEALTADQMRTMKLSIERVQIEAQTRKLKAEYTLELTQDLKNVHGLDAEAEIINILEYEIGAELDRELVDLMKNKATQTGSWNYNGQAAQGSANAFNNADGRWEAEKIRTLYTRILSEANKVALTTRRGTANIIIASSNVVTALESLSGFMYSAVPGNVKPTLGVAKVGTLDGRFTVYLDTFATKDFALLAYKGNSQLDSGLVYCPYIPLMMQKVIDPQTFQPRIGFMTRDAITGNLLGTSNYYRYIPVDFTGSSLGGNGLWAA